MRLDIWSVLRINRRVFEKLAEGFLGRWHISQRTNIDIRLPNAICACRGGSRRRVELSEVPGTTGKPVQSIDTSVGPGQRVLGAQSPLVHAAAGVRAL